MRGAERRFGGDVGMSRYGRYGGGELPGRRGGGECSLADSRRKGELPRRAEQPAREGRKERGREGERRGGRRRCRRRHFASAAGGSGGGRQRVPPPC